MCPQDLLEMCRTQVLWITASLEFILIAINDLSMNVKAPENLFPQIHRGGWLCALKLKDFWVLFLLGSFTWIFLQFAWQNEASTASFKDYQNNFLICIYFNLFLPNLTKNIHVFISNYCFSEKVFWFLSEFAYQSRLYKHDFSTNEQFVCGILPNTVSEGWESSGLAIRRQHSLSRSPLNTRLPCL